jgi:uncharacterized phage protein (TIGR02216 family)
VNRIDWLRLMRLGLVEIGLRPREFWDMTPAELMLLAGIDARGGAAMTRPGLDALMARFPDRAAPREEA